MLYIFTSITLITIGLFLIFSYKLRFNSIMNKIYLFSQNAFLPKNKFNHLIWGFITLFLGVLMLFRERSDQKTPPPNGPLINNFENWWYKDPLLWFVICLFFIIVIIRSKEK